MTIGRVDHTCQLHGHYQTIEGDPNIGCLECLKPKQRHRVPILIPRKEVEKAAAVLLREPQAPFIAFFDYEVGDDPDVRPQQEPKLSKEHALKVASDVASMLDGTHPMFNKEYLKQKLEQIQRECKEFGIEILNRPMHEVLIELNAARKNKLKL